MKGEQLPEDHTVGKHCQPKEMVIEEAADGTLIPVGVQSSAFLPDANGVSVGWLEQHAGNRNQQIRSMANCMCSYRTVRKSHRLALLPISAISRCGKLRGAHLWVEHDPIEGYDCDSLICGIDPNETELTGLIAAEVLVLEVMLV